MRLLWPRSSTTITSRSRGRRLRTGGTTWTLVGASSNDLYLTLHDPAVAPLYHTVVHLGSHNAAGQSTESGTVNAAWGEFTDRDVKRIRDNLTMVYNHDADTALSAERMLAHSAGKGQCTAWADLWVQVLAAQGISATSTRIAPGSGYVAFSVRLMPAQGTGGANYTPGTGDDPFGFHQVVRVSGFTDTIFDPSYGTRTDKSDTRSVELKYEDENITRLWTDATTWIPDTKGLVELTFTP